MAGSLAVRHCEQRRIAGNATTRIGDGCKSLSGIGHFLEFSVRTPDVLTSLNFYKTLGFSELLSADVWKHRYAVVSDGVLCIGVEIHEGPVSCFPPPVRRLIAPGRKWVNRCAQHKPARCDIAREILASGIVMLMCRHMTSLDGSRRSRQFSASVKRIRRPNR